MPETAQDLLRRAVFVSTALDVGDRRLVKSHVADEDPVQGGVANTGLTDRATNTSLAVEGGHVFLTESYVE
ncbi:MULTISPECIES: hypothetical protein [unclassified Pseudonocardia]|uniref:hypothetical protein n=1 Tax=unclassified Pseudonocardia TaxID=2619320 RepID=UPI0011150B62|nr:MULTISPECIES: hypothetical protein [unclassified Pseudonocardia]